MSNPITPLTPRQTEDAEAAARKEGYIERDLVAGDQAIATLLGDRVPDETISAWSARSALRPGRAGFMGRTMSRFLNLFQKDHGAKAVAGDEARGAAVVQVEDQAGIVNGK